VQAISVLALLNSQNLLVASGLSNTIVVVGTLVAGAMIMMWLGELINERGIGNGISMILLAGIISQIPSGAASLFVFADTVEISSLLLILILLLGVIWTVVFMNEALRKIPIQYAKRIRGGRQYGGQQTHLPIKVNVAGVMPIIFAVSLMMLPSFVGRLLLLAPSPNLVTLGEQIIIHFSPTSLVYLLTYFVLVFAFSYFSAIIFFNAQDISDELKKSGAFVPGIRPGSATRKFLEFVVTRITFAGALFLALIAVLPSIAQILTGIQSLAVGGTSILIVVSVILDTSKQINSQLLSENYEKYS
jgi:preprotein translocase subunit SecY